MAESTDQSLPQSTLIPSLIQLVRPGPDTQANPTTNTVSKVLRLKDKYLHPEDGSRSPIKRSKGKFPDIERAVSNWAKNHQRQGLPLSNECIRDKARMFATTVGSSDCVSKVNNPSWLEKFKQKNGLLGAGVPDWSDNEDADMIQPSDPASGEQTPNAISPISPAGDRSGSVEDDVLKDANGNNYREFGFRRTHSESNNSLGSYFTDRNLPSTFSPDIRSSTSPFFSPISSCGPSPSIPSQTPRLPKLAPADSRPRRQTFPNIGSAPSYITPPASATIEPMPTTQLFQQSMANSTLSSPLEELEDPTPSIDSTMNHHHSSISPSAMAPPPNPSSVSPSNPPPSQDEARRALETLLTFIEAQSEHVDPHDYFTMGKLMEKLKLRRDDFPGALRSLNDKGRKRSIHSLS
ncbi:MAG: hypothetical protein Q9221_000373 [Calogaya cf. arnoldii]